MKHYKSGAIIIIFSLLILGCSNIVTTTKVATPTFSPAAGTYTTDQTVTISTATSGATIYYTTNGDTPTTSSSVYSSPISIAGNGTSKTIKAIAAKTGMTTSDVASGSYTIIYPKVATPSFSISAGVYYTSPKTVVINCATAGATIRYTTDGTTPSTTNGTIITSGNSVSIGKTTTLKAIAYKTGWMTSDINSQTYSIKARTKFTVTTQYIWATAYGPMSNEGLNTAQELYGYFKLSDTGNSSNYSYAYNIARSSYITINCTHILDTYFSSDPMFYAKPLGSDSDCIIYERTATLTVNNSNSIEFISSLKEADSFPFTDEDLGTLALRWTFNGSGWTRTDSNSNISGEFGLICFYHSSSLGTYTRVYILTPKYEFVE